MPVPEISTPSEVTPHPGADAGLAAPSEMSDLELEAERRQLIKLDEAATIEQLERHTAILREMRQRSAPTGAPKSRGAKPTVDDI